MPLEILKPPSLVVKLPLSAFLSGKVEDSATLLSRLKLSRQFSPEWSLVEKEDTISLYKLVVSAGIACAVTIDKQLSWSLKLGETVVNLCEFDLPHTICSVAEVSKVVKYIDESTFCVRNPDAKFEGLIRSHKGIFKNLAGKYHNFFQTNRQLIFFKMSFCIIYTGTEVVAYHDTRSLPTPSIRNHNCSIFVRKESTRCVNCTKYRQVLHAMVSRTTTTVNRVATTS